MIASCSSGRLTTDKVPSVIVNTVHQKFPGASKIDWEKNGMVYEAEIQENKSQEFTVELNVSGEILRIKQDIQLDNLPVAVNNVLASGYKEFKIDDLEKLEKNGKVFYQVELKGKGRSEEHLVFDENGNKSGEVYWD